MMEADQVRLPALAEAVPWREFRWYRKQRHFPGSYWSATTRGLIGYESRLELVWLREADFDRQVTRIVSQPFLMEAVVDDRIRRHIPDYLLVREDESVCVLDVKPFEMLNRPTVRASLSWSREVVEQLGWEYRVESEPDPVRLMNVRFLAGYRRDFQFSDSERLDAMATLDAATTLGAAFRAVELIAGGEAFARALVLHLLWRRQLAADLTRPLQRTSIVNPS